MQMSLSSATEKWGQEKWGQKNGVRVQKLTEIPGLLRSVHASVV